MLLTEMMHPINANHVTIIILDPTDTIHTLQSVYVVIIVVLVAHKVRGGLIIIAILHPHHVLTLDHTKQVVTLCR